MPPINFCTHFAIGHFRQSSPARTITYHVNYLNLVPRAEKVSLQIVRSIELFFYIYGSVHRWSILIIVQRDATQSSLFIILQVHSTCFAYQPHPSSGVHKTLTTASGTGHAVLCSYLPPTWPTWPSWREVAAQYRRLSYSFVYSWWWVWLTRETCRVNLQNNK